MRYNLNFLDSVNLEELYAKLINFESKGWEFIDKRVSSGQSFLILIRLFFFRIKEKFQYMI